MKLTDITIDLEGNLKYAGTSWYVLVRLNVGLSYKHHLGLAKYA